MSTLATILLATFTGSIIALVGGLALIANEKWTAKISHFLASFAAGILLGTAFLDLLPEATQKAENNNVNIFAVTLAGIVLFFFIERFIHWFHHHEQYHQHQKETKSTIPLIIISDTVHNFLDGVIIAATFLISVPTGIVTTLAVFAHEVPQEIGDFGLLLHKGVSRKRIIVINILSASVAMLGAVFSYIFGDFVQKYIPVFLALTAGFFIYIATSDLIPEIHYERRKGFAQIETFLLIFGILVIWISVSLLEHP